MVRVLVVLLLVTNIFAQEGDIFDTPPEQETIRLEGTIPSTAPVAVVEAFKVVPVNGEGLALRNSIVKCG